MPPKDAHIFQSLEPVIGHSEAKGTLQMLLSQASFFFKPLLNLLQYCFCFMFRWYVGS